MAPLSLIGLCLTWLMLAVGCAGPGAGSSAAGVERVFAHVRGIT